MIKQFHHSEFLPLEKIYAKKEKTGISISCVIPTLNEASTVGDIITTTRRELMETLPLLDEIIVMDGDSDDNTVHCAQESGALVYKVNEIGDTDTPMGKGTALWKSLSVAKGDIIVCIDADIREFDHRFVYGLIAPLLLDSTLVFVKGYYKRPMVVEDVTLDNYGGRVTEILVRPILSAFYPELARLFQPLAGEYSFRKDIISRIPFYSGYSVEIGLVLDLYKQFGLSAIAQVDMDIRCHRNRSVVDLGKMAFGILQILLKKLEKDNKASFPEPFLKNMISLGNNGWEETHIEEYELPPIIQSNGGGI